MLAINNHCMKPTCSDDLKEMVSLNMSEDDEVQDFMLNTYSFSHLRMGFLTHDQQFLDFTSINHSNF